MMSDKLSVEAIEMLADDYERGMIGPRRLRQYFDYLIQQLAAAETALAEEAKKREQAEVKFYERENAYVSTVTLLVDQKAELKNKLKQAEAQCAAMRKTLTDIAHATFRGEKSPESICAAICLNNLDSARAAILAELQRYREALREISEIQMVQYEPPFIIKNPMQIAKAALEERPVGDGITDDTKAIQAMINGRSTTI